MIDIIKNGSNKICSLLRQFRLKLSSVAKRIDRAATMCPNIDLSGLPIKEWRELDDHPE